MSEFNRDPYELQRRGVAARNARVAATRALLDVTGRGRRVMVAALAGAVVTMAGFGASFVAFSGLVGARDGAWWPWVAVAIGALGLVASVPLERRAKAAAAANEAAKAAWDGACLEEDRTLAEAKAGGVDVTRWWVPA